MVIPKYKNIPGFSDYRVGEDGSVWKRFRGIKNDRGSYWRRLVGHPDKAGYIQIRIRRDGRAHFFLLHHLVLVTFVGPCPKGKECCHEDDIKSSNAVGNLRWDTPKANADDARRNGTARIGTKHGMAKLTEQDVLEIRKSYKKGKHNRLAERFGVTAPLIRMIHKRQIWRHI